MADHFTERETTGFLGNMGKSIMAVPIGILLFFLSFVVFWKTEGRTDWSKVAGSSTEVAADAATGSDGAFVSVTGPLKGSAPVGDPDFLAPADWVTLERAPEMFAWVEKTRTEEKKKVGGGTERITHYDYERAWTREPEPASEFKYPQGHENPAMAVPAASFAAPSASVGAWTFTTTEATLPGGEPVPLASATLVGKGVGAQVVGEAIFLGKGTPDVPQVGDVRVGWKALPGGRTVTIFGQASGGRLTPYLHQGEDRFFRALLGTRGEALAKLKAEFKAMGWVGRAVGFVMMWIGMTMVFAPLHGVLDILPFMGKVSRGLVGCITFPIALVLSSVAILLSMLFHSIVAMIVVALLLGGLAFFTWKQKQKAG